MGASVTGLSVGEGETGAEETGALVGETIGLAVGSEDTGAEEVGALVGSGVGLTTNGQSTTLTSRTPSLHSNSPVESFETHKEYSHLSLPMKPGMG